MSQPLQAFEENRLYVWEVVPKGGHPIGSEHVTCLRTLTLEQAAQWMVDNPGFELMYCVSAGVVGV